MTKWHLVSRFGPQFPFGQQIFPFGHQIWSANVHLVSRFSYLLTNFFHLVTRFSHLVSRFSHLVTKFGPQFPIWSPDFPSWSADLVTKCHLVTKFGDQMPFGHQIWSNDPSADQIWSNDPSADQIWWWVGELPKSSRETELEGSGEHFQRMPLATCTPSFHETLSFMALSIPHQKIACLRVLGFSTCHCPTWFAEDYFFVLDFRFCE